MSVRNAFDASQMQWSRVTKQGHLASQSHSVPQLGVFYASVRIPFTDDQGTMQFYAIDGVVMHPRFCCNGQQRDAFYRMVVAEAKAYVSPEVIAKMQAAKTAAT